MLNSLLPGETLPGTMQLLFSSSFAAVMPERKADKNGALDQLVDRFRKSDPRFSERNIRQISMYCEIFTQTAQ